MRKEQIVQAVLRVVSEYGVLKTTTHRIAAAAGVSEGTLYLHFADRSEMFIAALEAIFVQMKAVVEASEGLGALERLRDIVARHSKLMNEELGGFGYPWLEFVAAGPQAGLREAIAETQRRAFRMTRDVVEQGKREGVIRSDVDSDQLAWQCIMTGWSDNMSSLMGLSEYFQSKQSEHALELFLKNATVPASERAVAPEAPAE